MKTAFTALKVIAALALLYVASWPPLEAFYYSRKMGARPESVRAFYTPARKLIARLDNRTIDKWADAYYAACYKALGGSSQ